LEPLTTDHVQQALDARLVGVRIRIFEESTATSALAAAALGCALGQIAKSICFLVEDQPVLVVASGDQQVDDRKIAAALNVSRKRVKLAKADECLRIWGFAPGGVPPVGHRTPMKHTFLDQMLRRYDVIYAAGGSADSIFPLTLDQLELVTGGQWLDTARAAEPS
jgi:prolyl-tRNA editing enzyme YbaK/EbsC (Cys-tRNA(Pro) deacylase)